MNHHMGVGGVVEPFCIVVVQVVDLFSQYMERAAMFGIPMVHREGFQMKLKERMVHAAVLEDIAGILEASGRGQKS